MVDQLSWLDRPDIRREGHRFSRHPSGRYSPPNLTYVILQLIGKLYGGFDKLNHRLCANWKSILKVPQANTIVVPEPVEGTANITLNHLIT